MAAKDDNVYRELTGSILTPSQREFLMHGPKEGQSAASIRMRKSRIRDRLGAAMVDFSVLLTSDQLDIEDFDSAFAERVDVQFPPVPAELLQEAIGVLFLGAMAVSPATEDVEDEVEAAVDRFGGQVLEGIERALARRGEEVTASSIDLEIAIDPVDPPEDSKPLYELPADQLELLRLGKYISEAEYAEAMGQRYSHPPVGEDQIDK